MELKTDDAILNLLFERDEAALQEIQAAYGKLCCKLANDILNSREDSEECVNDMLMKVWQTIPPKHPDSLLAYVITIIRNTAVNKYLAQKTEKRGGKQFEAAWEEIEDTLVFSGSVRKAPECFCLHYIMFISKIQELLWKFFISHIRYTTKENPDRRNGSQGSFCCGKCASVD